MSFHDYLRSGFLNPDVPCPIDEHVIPLVEWMTQRLSHDWKFTSRTVAMGTLGMNADVRIQIWFSFDSAEDAMLARLTWSQLQSPEYANS